MERKLEILAPAGSFESLKAAIMAGADAVYMGGSRFGARAYADNPQGELLLEAIDYAHLYGIKVYLTVNTLLKERELMQELYEYLLPCYEHGVDAVIIQDLGVIRAVREWFPDLPVHASTQMTLCGSGGVRLLKEAGVRRAVLARELSLAEINRIHRDTEMELECFVHGALCYCYSGQCLFSSILGGRSGNRGRCAQPCRLAYEVTVSGKTKSAQKMQNLLSPKDICAIDLLPQIAEAGVCSLKIEGRMKRPEYTAGIVRIYRKYVDRYLREGSKGYQVSETDKKELLLLFNRDGFSQGYFTRHNGRGMMALSERKQTDREKKAYEELIRSLRRDYVEKEKKIAVKGCLYAKAGSPMKLELTTAVDKGKTEETDGLAVFGACPQTSQDHPVGAGQLERQLRKTGNTPFEWSELRINSEGSLFIPVQAINGLRREALETLRNRMIQTCFRVPLQTPFVADACVRPKSYNQFKAVLDRQDIQLHISAETKEQLREILLHADRLKQKRNNPLTAVYVDAEGMEKELKDAVEQIHTKGLRAYVMLPCIFRAQTADRYKKADSFWSSLLADGYVFRNLEEYEYLRCRGWKKDLISDHNIYIWNQNSRIYWQEKGVCMRTNPLELNGRELETVSDKTSIQIIYGRYPMMVTAGCLHKTMELCRRREEIWYLKDRYHKKFPVKNFCLDCYNVIYNSQPLYLLDQTEQLERIGAGAYRIMFTTESREETGQVLEQWAEHRKPEADFTRGHFKRGVE